VRSLVFTQAARAELIEAQDWYESEAQGLGRRFRSEVDAAVRRIAENPLQFPVIFKTLRRARLRKFPYGLFFAISGGAVTVVACFHSSRDPKGWRVRA
jgi:plasmid stabilization system protein ParE